MLQQKLMFALMLDFTVLSLQPSYHQLQLVHQSYEDLCLPNLEKLQEIHNSPGHPHHPDALPCPDSLHVARRNQLPHRQRMKKPAGTHCCIVLNSKQFQVTFSDLLHDSTNRN